MKDCSTPLWVSARKQVIPYFGSRFRISEGWVWKDDIDYSRTEKTGSSTIVLDKPNANQTTGDELPPSVAQDTGLDYGQGRYLELEGVDDYVLFHEGYPEPTRKQINRKWEWFLVYRISSLSELQRKPFFLKNLSLEWLSRIQIFVIKGVKLK